MEEFVRKNQNLFIYLLVGLILIGLGVFIFKNGSLSKSNSVEVLNSVNTGPESLLELVVEIAGEVEKPGVYKFPNGARIDDLLIACGGISAEADREWVEKTINRAAKLTDGQKLFIPSQSEVLSANTNGGIKLDQGTSGSLSLGLININSASLNQLDTLPGIGPVYGQNIIEQRPYSNIDELLTKGVLKTSVYEKIKDLITAF